MKPTELWISVVTTPFALLTALILVIIGGILWFFSLGHFDPMALLCVFTKCLERDAPREE